MVWNTMILSQYVWTRQLIGRPVDPADREPYLTHYRVTRLPVGGWGMHPESDPSVFCTTLAYVALRLLGLGPDDPLTAPAARWLRAQPGGVRAVPSWGKFWLSMAGLYDYRAVSPMLPETFLLPSWFPLHPDRFYCHTRLIYQAMAYLYGVRFRTDLGPLGEELSRELYGAPVRDAVRPGDHALLGADGLVPPGRALRAVTTVARGYERHHLPRLRTAALKRCLARVEYEQRSTAFHGLSPVSSLLNCLVLYSRDPGHPLLEASVAALDAWRWTDAERGTRYAGARSQSWDTSFAMEALTQSPGRGEEADKAVRDGADYLLGAQALEELPQPDAGARDAALGGWCFSDGFHRWPVSDCTAEALSALLHAGRVSELTSGEGPLPQGRLAAAVRFILQRQNRDGSFGTYERRRGSRLLEALNPSEMFTGCMVEGSYTECTGSALAALALARPHVAASLADDLDRAVRRGAAFLRSVQRADGSFPAFWGVNRIYGTLFAVRGLRAAGAGPSDPALSAAARWLRTVQSTDGSWGEHYSGCLTDHYVPHPQGQPVMTAWALLALMHMTDEGDPAVERGVRWLCEQQRPDGSWPELAVNGVFFGTAMLDYRLYHQYFPAWALARYSRSAATDRPADLREGHPRT